MNTHTSSLSPARRLLMLATAAVALLPALAHAAPPVNTIKGGLLGGLGGRGDVAILGYDTVAYFTEGKPVKGSDKLAHEWMGAKWHFASQAHLDLFRANPEKYAPQYGGYCAYGVSQGYLVAIEPDKFKVIDGKLYLNYDAAVQEKWNQDPAGYIRQADARIKALLAQ